MGRYVTPRGVEVELGDEAARAVGYQPAAKPAEEPKKKTPAKKSASRKSEK
jgi:hypothetical protein